MKRYFSFVLIFILLLAWPSSLGHSQERSGKYIIYYGGEESGIETYSISESEGKFKLSDRSEFRAGGQAFLVDLNLWTDSSYRVLNLNLNGRSVGNDFQVTTRFEEGKAINLISGIADTTTEIPVHEDALIMPNGLFLPYSYLVERYDFQKGGKQEFFAFVVPQVDITIQVEDKGDERVDFETGAVELKRLLVSLGGMLGVNVWVNADGQILKLNIPVQGIEVFREGCKPAPAKVETDAPPGLYSSQDITFQSGHLELAGTVTVPRNGQKSHPAAIIISGSGPQDRNGVTPELKFSVQYKALANALSNSGILVLRYDERGVGESQGVFRTATFTDFISDVKAGISYLKARSDVDKSRVCLVGHSEGAIIAPKISSEDTTIKAIVLKAGPAKPLDQVIMEQQGYVLDKLNTPEEMKRQAMDQQKDFFAWVRGEKQWDQKKLQQLGPLVDQKHWFLEHLQHDPLQTIKRVRCKVLILQGAKDRQVFQEHAKLLNRALDESGNQKHILKIFPDLDHLFCKTEGEGDYAAYADTERPLDQQFLDFLVDWLKKEL